MGFRRIGRIGAFGGFGAVLAVMAGCVEYEVQTTLRTDGSGTRIERVVVDRRADESVQIAPEAFVEVMHLTDVRGWDHTREPEGDEELHVFTRRKSIEATGSWSQLDGDIRIDGVEPPDRDSRIRHVRAGDVRFVNAVNVEVQSDADGSTYTFRERFRWRKLLSALVEMTLEYFAGELDERYPNLDPARRGEVIGMVKGGLWMAIERGYLDMEGSEEEEMERRFADRIAEQALEILDVDAGDDRAFLRATLLTTIEGPDGLDPMLDERLPGARLGWNTGIRFELTMPGRVIDTNAHDRDGDTLIWEFSPFDAAQFPVEVFAESRLEN